MTEAEWLSCDDPQRMLTFLRGKVSERKVRLFTCACCVSIVRYLQGYVKVLVRRTEQGADNPEMDACISSQWRNHHAFRSRPEWLTVEGEDDQPYLFAINQASAALNKVSKARQQVEREARMQYLRCVFGNPFRPVTIAQTWLTVDVVSLTQAVADERGFDCLPILADALEDAGCTNSAILDHCRQQGKHVRGCWVVDLILDKK